MWNEFKQFILRGNVLDLAVGIIVGGAFGRIVTSLVNDILMPPLGLVLGRVDFNNLFLTLSGPHKSTLDQARAVGAVTINYGAFINNIVDFLIVAFAVFLLVRGVNRLYRKPVKAADTPSTKACPYCMSAIHIRATRCPECTSMLTGAVGDQTVLAGG